MKRKPPALGIRARFPLGKAHGSAFCNRTKETAWLVTNLLAGKHCLLIAPRRFGKSSLAEHAILQSKLPAITLNFNACGDEQDIAQVIQTGVGLLIGKALGPVEKFIQQIKQQVTHLVPKIILGTGMSQLELTVSESKTSISLQVGEMLALLEKLLQQNKQKAILLLDEFQAVGLISRGTGIEATIRNVIQDTSYLSVIFSGSNRGLLSSMFETENRPLYKLCRKLTLDRIEKVHYEKHLNQAALATWNCALRIDVFEQIMHYSDRHPYYVNYLCDVLWGISTKGPNMENVEEAWQIVLEEENSDAMAEIALLSLKQKKILKYLANNQKQLPLSAEVARHLSMATSSIAGALAGLREKDVIELRDENYHIINPVIAAVLTD